MGVMSTNMLLFLENSKMSHNSPAVLNTAESVLIGLMPDVSLPSATTTDMEQPESVSVSTLPPTTRITTSPVELLDRLLDTDDLIAQIQGATSLLVSYLVSDGIIDALVERLLPPETTEPTDELRALRLPFHASEILCAETLPMVQSRIAMDPNLLERLFDIVGTEHVRHPVTLTYAAQCLTRVLSNHPGVVRAYATSASRKVFASLVRNVHHISVRELLFSLISVSSDATREDMALMEAACGDEGGRLAEALKERVKRARLTEGDNEIAELVLRVISDLLLMYDHGPSRALRLQLSNAQTISELWSCTPYGCAYFAVLCSTAACIRDVLDDGCFTDALLASSPSILEEIKKLLQTPIRCEPPLPLPDRTLRYRVGILHISAIEALTAFFAVQPPQGSRNVKLITQTMEAALSLASRFPLHSILHSTVRECLTTALHHSPTFIEVLTPLVVRFLLLNGVRPQGGTHYFALVGVLNTIRLDHGHPTRNVVETQIGAVKGAWRALEECYEAMLADRDKKLTGGDAEVKASETKPKKSSGN